jgi:hypothetical protein
MAGLHDLAAINVFIVEMAREKWMPLLHSRKRWRVGQAYTDADAGNDRRPESEPLNVAGKNIPQAKRIGFEGDDYA